MWWSKIVCSFVLKRASAILAATAMPTAFATPWPSGPVVVSTPLGACVSSGCPGVFECSCRKCLISSSEISA